MRILLLAPQPFYIVRGTPIDVELVVRVLSQRPDTEIDMVVYAEGEDRKYPGTTLHRVGRASWMRTRRPGFSLRKLLSTAAMFFCAWSLVHRRRPDLIHAGEESVFLAMFFRVFYRIPYAYDLDSSIAQQISEQLSFLSFLQPFFDFCETQAIRRAMITFPVCNALADLCRKRGARKVVTLHDISQIDPDRVPSGRLRRETGSDKLLLLYAGNLEPYQGIDLLLEGFAQAARETEAVDLVIIGGGERDITRYRAKAETLGIGSRCHFLGPRPFEELDDYLLDADILTAPRIRGQNTPMKVFPYLHSGRPVLVTDLPTHTQILTPELALLAEPTPEGFGRAIVDLASDEALRRRLGSRGREFVERDHVFAAHQARLDAAYDWIESQLG